MTPSYKYRVVVVDDSAFMRLMITRAIESDPDLEVVGIARDGLDAIKVVKSLKPDVVTLDVEMPRMNGLQCLIELMDQIPTPVVMVSSLTVRGAQITFKSLEIGAVDFVAKPDSGYNDNFSQFSLELREKVKMAATMDVEKLQSILRQRRSQIAKTSDSYHRWVRRFEILAIGCSTGGPGALHTMLPGLPQDCPVPVVVAQHMPPGFTKFLAKNLSARCKVPVVEAQDNMEVSPGTVAIAPSGKQTIVVKSKGGVKTRILEDSTSLYRPSINVLFESVALAFGDRAIGVILTGMGNDGAVGLLKMKQAGAVTFAESGETTVVNGMPKAAVEIGAVSRIVPLYEMVGELLCIL